MAKAPQSVAEKEVTGERLPLMVEQSQDETPDETALYNLLTELDGDGTGAKVSIWRVNEQITGRGAGKDTYLTAMSPSDFAVYGLDGIQMDYGEGKYRVKVNLANGQIATNRIFPIGPLPKSKQVAAAPFQQQPQRSESLDGFQALIATMQQGFNSLAQILANQGSQNEAAMLAKLQAYKSLFGGAPVQQQQTNPLEMLTTAVTLAKELGGVDNPKSTLEVIAEVAKEFMPAISAIAVAQAERGVPRQPQPQQPQPQQPPQLTAPAAPLPFPQTQQTQEAQTPMGMLEMQLKMVLPMMLQQAAQNNDSYKYADMVLDFVDVSVAEGLANRPDWFDWLASLNPGVRQFEPWFRGFHTNLLQVITQEKQAEVAGDLTSAAQSGFNAIGAPDE
jgi:hypothetical protein